MVLWSVIVAVLATVFDAALMGLIGPSVASDLQADGATIGLISSIGVLMTAAFILGGGTLGDIYGRKRFLSYGLIGLIITSLLAFVVPGASLLIPVRALAGIMTAIVSPLALAIIMITFDREERPKALGLYGASLGIVGGLGTIIIAFLNQQFGWRATFGLVILFAAIALVMVMRFVKESKAGGEKSVDWVGILLAAAGLFGLIYGINQAASQGFGSSAVLVPVAIGLVLLVALALYSQKKKDPALQLVLFNKPEFAVGVLLFAFMGFAAMGAFFQLSTYLQSLQKVSPIQASLTLLPYTLALFVFAIVAGGWVGKFSNKLLIGGGLALMAVGLVLMTFFLSPTAGFGAYLLPLVLLGGGFSIANTPRISVVLGSAPPELAGSASATNNAFQQLGTSMGIAMMGALFQVFAKNAYFSDLTGMGLAPDQIDKSVQVLGEWLKTNAGDVASQFGITVQQLQGVITEYHSAFTSGVTGILWVGAVVVAVGAVLAWFTFGKKAE
jgi:DHA2 family multidrug resistance protein-like MFS transporter